MGALPLFLSVDGVGPPAAPIVFFIARFHKQRAFKKGEEGGSRLFSNYFVRRQVLLRKTHKSGRVRLPLVLMNVRILLL